MKPRDLWGGDFATPGGVTKVMKNIVIIAFAVALAACIACGKSRSKTEDLQALASETGAEQQRELPDGAIAFDYTGHLYFDVVVRDSIPARMIFDTGNTNILIDNKFFKKHFAPSPTLQRSLIQGAGNSLEAVYRDTAEWIYSVGEEQQTEQGAIVMDLQKILGSGVDGMFGMEFMRGRRVEFNFADEYMRLLQPDEPLADGYVCIKCKWLDARESRILLPVSVQISDGTAIEGNFLVDMGARDGLVLNSSLAAKLNLRSVIADAKKKVLDAGGVGGSRTDYLFRAKEVSVGGFEIADVNAIYSGNTMGAMADDSYDGLIGNALLERFDVVFDFAKGEIWLRPNKNFSAEKRYDSGVTLTPQEDCWVVNGLVEGGNGDKAGLRRGDVVMTINGLTPKQIDGRLLKRMNESAEGWRLSVKRGESDVEIEFEKEQ